MDAIADAVAAVKRGELIVLPTETVYGIGAAPHDPAATAKLFDAKRRPRDLTLPVLTASVEVAARLARFDDRADRLATALWPGPLTLVLPRTDESLAWDLGGDGATIGLRVPSHPLALAVLSAAGPIATTSANRSGAPPAATCDELHAAFGDLVAVYLCQEEPPAGTVSTVVDLTDRDVRILRAGGVDSNRVARLLGDDAPLLDSPPPGDPGSMTSILVICTGNICRSPIAEGLLRDGLQRRFTEKALVVASAGTGGLEGSRARPESVRAAAELGVDIGGHVARRLTTPMAEEFDLLLCMGTDHRDVFADSRLGERAFTLKEIVRLLETLPPPAPGAGLATMSERIAAANMARRRGGIAASRDDDVADPLGQPLEAYRAIAWELETWIERLVNGLFGAIEEADAAERS